MNLETLLATEPTLSENNSLKLYKEICFDHPSWRCYYHKVLDERELEKLASRYLTNHATIPGLITPEVLAHIPMQIFSFTAPTMKITGALFLNGAVVWVEPKEELPYWVLFVEDRVAKAWRYPEEYANVSKILAPLNKGAP